MTTPYQLYLEVAQIKEAKTKWQQVAEAGQLLTSDGHRLRQYASTANPVNAFRQYVAKSPELRAGMPYPTPHSADAVNVARSRAHVEYDPGLKPSPQSKVNPESFLPHPWGRESYPGMMQAQMIRDFRANLRG